MSDAIWLATNRGLSGCFDNGRGIGVLAVDRRNSERSGADSTLRFPPSGITFSAHERG